MEFWFEGEWEKSKPIRGTVRPPRIRFTIRPGLLIYGLQSGSGQGTRIRGVFPVHFTRYAASQEPSLPFRPAPLRVMSRRATSEGRAPRAAAVASIQRIGAIAQSEGRSGSESDSDSSDKLVPNPRRGARPRRRTSDVGTLRTGVRLYRASVRLLSCGGRPKTNSHCIFSFIFKFVWRLCFPVRSAARRSGSRSVRLPSRAPGLIHWALGGYYRAVAVGSGGGRAPVRGAVAKK